MACGENRVRDQDFGVSRYFKYKTSQALLADSQALGLSIELSADMSPLLQPIDVGGRRVGNRLAIQPMEGCDAGPDGAPGELTYRRYQRFGAGGAKLIWGEAAAVVPEGRANPRQLIINEANAPALETAPPHGAPGPCRGVRRRRRPPRRPAIDPLRAIFVPERRCWPSTTPSSTPGPSSTNPRIAPSDPEDPLLSDDDLDRLQDHFAEAAALAYRIGFDFVDVKQCHRYLLNELLSARSRPGKYGGSLENRTRFIRDLVSRIRSENPGRIIATRLNVFDGIPYQKGPDGRGVPCPFSSPVHSAWGTDPEDPSEPDLAEPIALIGWLRDLGVALINVSIGNPYASPHLLRPFEYPPPDGYETPEHPLIGVDRHFRMTAAIQAAHPEVAVVGSGYSWLQAFAFEAGAANVAAGRTAFVGIGRGALSQPDFGVRLVNGEPLDRKRLCRTFSYCTALMRSKHNELGQFPTGCPPFDKDVYGPIWDDAGAK